MFYSMMQDLYQIDPIGNFITNTIFFKLKTEVKKEKIIRDFTSIFIS